MPTVVWAVCLKEYGGDVPCRMNWQYCCWY